MASVARKIEPTSVFEETGTIVGRKGAALMVESGSGTYAAKRAVSCLVEPEPGDLVLAAVAQGGAAYVLAVLERPLGAPATLSAEGDLSIRLPSGRFVVAAQEGVDLISAKDMSVVAGDLKVTAASGTVAVSRLSFLSALVQGEIERVKLLADTVYQRVKRSYRVVDEIDQVKAEQIDYTAKEHVRLHAKNALITAESLVKVDGDQIHLG